MFHHQPWANEVDAQHTGEIFDRVVEDTFHAAGNASVSKGDIKMAVQFDRFCDNRGNIRLIACVHLDGGGGVANHGCGVMHRCGHIAQNDLCTFGGKANGRCAANP